MKFLPIRFYIFYLLLCIPGMGFSQSAIPVTPLRDALRTKLPPLSDLIDSALAHDPHFQVRNLQVSANQYKVNEVQNQWLRNFGLQGNLGYGTFDYLYNNTLGGQTPSAYTSSQTLTQYGVGAYIRFPIYDLIGRNNELRLAKTEKLQAGQMAEAREREVRQQVIVQYNDLIEKQSVLRIQVKYVETSRINMQMAEKEFSNGVISISEFTRISEIVNRAETGFESAKMSFQTAFMLFEETVGMKLNIE